MHAGQQGERGACLAKSIKGAVINFGANIPKSKEIEENFVFLHEKPQGNAQMHRVEPAWKFTAGGILEFIDSHEAPTVGFFKEKHKPNMEGMGVEEVRRAKSICASKAYREFKREEIRFYKKTIPLHDEALEAANDLLEASRAK